MRAVLFSSALFALTACTNPTEISDTISSNIAPSDGWVLSAQGDLNAFFDCLDEAGVSLVSAHRGGMYPGLPENAIETMTAVLDAAPALMEIDIATSKDGVLYLMHDDTLERTTTGEGSANALNWDEIKALNLEDDDGVVTNFSPPTFSDVLRWAKGRTLLQLDFKQTTKYEDVIDEVRRQNAQDSIIFIAYSLGSAVKLHRLMPEAMISLSIDTQSALNAAVAAGIPENRIMGFTGIEQTKPQLYSSLDKRGVEVIFGTLGGRDSIDNNIELTGDEFRYAEIAKDGVDLIATDRPIEANKALQNAGKAAVDGVCGIEKR